MARREREISVFLDRGTAKAAELGTLYVTRTRGQDIRAFAWAESWLNGSAGDLLPDPDLFLCSGRQYPPGEKERFGLFRDSCPDRCGWAPCGTRNRPLPCLCPGTGPARSRPGRRLRAR